MAQTAYHSKSTDNHRPERWRVQDEAARDALDGFTVDDIGKWVYIIETQQYQALVTYSPSVEWLNVAGGSTGSGYALLAGPQTFTGEHGFGATAEGVAARAYFAYVEADALPVTRFGSHAEADSQDTDAIDARSRTGAAVRGVTFGDDIDPGTFGTAGYFYSEWDYGLQTWSRNLIPLLAIGLNSGSFIKQQAFGSPFGDGDGGDGEVSVIDVRDPTLTVERAFAGQADNGRPVLRVIDSSAGGTLTGLLAEFKQGSTLVASVGRDGAITSDTASLTLGGETLALYSGGGLDLSTYDLAITGGDTTLAGGGYFDLGGYTVEAPDNGTLALLELDNLFEVGQRIQTGGTANRGLDIKAVLGQTAELIYAKDSSNNPLFIVHADGSVDIAREGGLVQGLTIYDDGEVVFESVDTAGARSARWANWDSVAFQCAVSTSQLDADAITGDSLFLNGAAPVISGPTSISAPIAGSLQVQASGTNTGTTLALLPNGSNSISAMLLFAGSNPDGPTGTQELIIGTGVGGIGASEWGFSAVGYADANVNTYPLVFRVGNSTNGRIEAARILNTGLVGIGITAPTSRLHVKTTDTGTNNIIVALTLAHGSSGSATTDFGSRLLFQGKGQSSDDRDMASIDAMWITGTAGSEASRLRFNTRTAGGVMTERAHVDGPGNFVIGTAALATNATAGFVYISTSAGAPTGTPTTHTGRAPIHLDTTNGRLYLYYGSAWHYATLT